MTSAWLRYLIAVADWGSISRAARECSISQPALTQSIRKVEEEVGHTLFRRKTHGVELTDCGRVFLNNARAMLFVENQTEAAIRELKRKENRQLRLFLEAMLRNMLYRRWTGPFHERMPEVEIQISTGSSRDGETYLLQDLAELAFFYTNHEFRRELEYEILDEAQLFLAVPEKSEAVRWLMKHPGDLKGLEKETFILYRGETEMRVFQQKILEKYRLYPRNILEADKITTVKHLVGTGYGISFLPDPMLREKGEDYRLFPLPEPFFYQIVLACRKGRKLSAPAACFRDMVREQAKGR